MEIQCRNCHSAFTFEALPAQTPDLAPCPRCAFGNPITAGEGGLRSARCARCGREMAAQPGQAVPICTTCAAQGEPEPGDPGAWMIRKAGGRTWGPYDTQTVAQWVEAGKLVPTDELAVAGGPWQPVYEIPRFAASLTDAQRAEAAREYKAARKAEAAEARRAANPPRQIPWRRIGAHVLALAAAAGSIAGALYTSEHRLLVIPEPWVDEARAVVEEQILARATAQRAAPDTVAEEAAAVVEGLRKRHDPPDRPSAVLRLEGQRLAFLDDPASAGAAQAALEQAVLANPRDPVALAALAEHYARLIRGDDSAWAKPALRLIDRAEQLGGGGAEVLRARAAFLIATDSLSKGQAKAQKALERSPADSEAAYLIGVAHALAQPPALSQAADALQAAIALNPRHQAAQRLLGDVSRQLLRYAAAAEHYKRKLALGPRSVETLYALGALNEEIGLAPEALDAYQQAIAASGRTHLPSLIAAGTLSLQHQADGYAARTLLSAAISSDRFEQLSLAQRKEALVQLAAAHLSVGDLAQAQRRVDEVLGLDGGDGPALFQAALIALAGGQRETASGLLRQANGVATTHEAQAQIRYALGAVAQLDDKPREALIELKAAIDADKHLTKAHLALVAVYLSSGQIDQALSTLNQLAHQDPLYERRRQFRATSYFHAPFDQRGIVPALQRVARERYYQAEPSANVGVALYHLGERRSAADHFSRALQIDGSNAVSAFYLGVMNLEANQPARAAQALIRAVQAEPGGGIYHAYLVEAYTQMGAQAEAEASLQRARQYLLDAPTVSLGMGLLRYAQGRRDEAREALIAALNVDPSFAAARQRLLAFGL